MMCIQAPVLLNSPTNGTFNFSVTYTRSLTLFHTESPNVGGGGTGSAFAGLLRFPIYAVDMWLDSDGGKK